MSPSRNHSRMIHDGIPGNKDFHHAMEGALRDLETRPLRINRAEWRHSLGVEPLSKLHPQQTWDLLVGQVAGYGKAKKIAAVPTTETLYNFEMQVQLLMELRLDTMT